jgi:hypothetical protein
MSKGNNQTEKATDMTLAEDMESQGYNVWDLIDLWEDSSELLMANPQATREDLQEEAFKWIRRFRELLKDTLRTEEDLRRSRTLLEKLSKEQADGAGNAS